MHREVVLLLGAIELSQDFNPPESGNLLVDGISFFSAASVFSPPTPRGSQTTHVLLGVAFPTPPFPRWCSVRGAPSPGLAPTHSSKPNIPNNVFKFERAETRLR